MLKNIILAAVMLLAAATATKAQENIVFNTVADTTVVNNNVVTAKESTKWIPKDGNHTMYISLSGAYDNEFSAFGGSAELGYFNHRNRVPFRVFLKGDYYSDGRAAYAAGLGIGIIPKAQSRINLWLDAYAGYTDQIKGVTIDREINGDIEGWLKDSPKIFEKEFYCGARVEVEFKASKKFSLIARGGVDYLPSNGSQLEYNVSQDFSGNIDVDTTSKKLEESIKKFSLKGEVGFRLYF